MTNRPKATEELLELLSQKGEPDNKVDRVRELLEVYHADATAESNLPMQLAAKNGLTKIGEMLLQHGATVDGETLPLFLSAYSGKRDFCEMLLNNGADVNIQTLLNGYTALHVAVKYSLDVCRVLLKRKDINVDSSDLRGVTPLIIAMQEGDWPTCRLLLEAGAKTDIVAKDGTIFSGDARDAALLEEMQKEGWTLHEGGCGGQCCLQQPCLSQPKKFPRSKSKHCRKYVSG